MRGSRQQVGRSNDRGGAGRLPEERATGRAQGREGVGLIVHRFISK